MPTSVFWLAKSKPAAPKAAAAPTAAPTPGIREPATPRMPMRGARISSTSFWTSLEGDSVGVKSAGRNVEDHICALPVLQKVVVSGTLLQFNVLTISAQVKGSPPTYT